MQAYVRLDLFTDERLVTEAPNVYNKCRSSMKENET